MELHQLQCFVVAVEEGGFKRATTRLGITQPALSYQIKQLEDELGTQLFHRRPTGVSPTETGRVLYDHAREMLEAVRRARRAVEELGAGVVGQIRIGTVDSVGIYFLPGVLGELRKKYPTVRPTVLYRTSDEVMDALLSDRVDLALIANPPPDRRLRQETVVEERVSLVCGRSHPYFGRKAIRPSELKGQDFVALSPESPTGDLVTKYLARLGVSVEPVVSTQNVETAKKMVEVGLGVGFLPDMVTSTEVACEPEPEHPGSLWRIEIGPPFARRIALVTWRNVEPSRAATAFIEELQRFGAEWKSCTECGYLSRA